MLLTLMISFHYQTEYMLFQGFSSKVHHSIFLPRTTQTTIPKRDKEGKCKFSLAKWRGSLANPSLCPVTSPFNCRFRPVTLLFPKLEQTNIHRKKDIDHHQPPRKCMFLIFHHFLGVEGGMGEQAGGRKKKRVSGTTFAWGAGLWCPNFNYLFFLYFVFLK